MPVRAIGINHIAFEVSDVDATLAWYERWFEITLRGRGRNMAFIDLGDQFVALTEVGGGAGGSCTGDGGRHVGVVVEDKEALRDTLRAAGEDVGRSGSLRLQDPSGNVIEIVDYRDVQFSKSDAVLRGMGLGGLEKSPSAIDELRAKGLTGE